ncbi:hypothetical protein BO99DRAFT_235440 [Aspergillus violaceofuscus CBS 115571]|uniref:Uncharacterized protein n=1 Tax=Aspergillus violaceofuscus (strain CBS 115571) TaxID=1450538 RepID=A0A2V5GX00_ASPV1|nr:hypothetical protein BO99DRAFT_235440 [Aspergillus violaceofuscus CBS 115571]
MSRWGEEWRGNNSRQTDRQILPQLQLKLRGQPGSLWSSDAWKSRVDGFECELLQRNQRNQRLSKSGGGNGVRRTQKNVPGPIVALYCRVPLFIALSAVLALLRDHLLDLSCVTAARLPFVTLPSGDYEGDLPLSS